MLTWQSHRAGPLQKRHPTDLGLADQLAFDELEAVSEGEEIAAFQCPKDLAIT